RPSTCTFTPASITRSSTIRGPTSTTARPPPMPGTEPRNSSAAISLESLTGDRAGTLPALSRRAFLSLSALSLGALALWPRNARAHDGHFDLGSSVEDQLTKGKLVYVSPLKKDGKESQCHGEVWYFFDKGDVVIGTATKGWKTRAVKA